MRLPDFRGVVVDGVPFVNLDGIAQSRYISAQIDAQGAEAAKNDPAALTAAEIERLDMAEAKLAEAMAAHESAAQRWVDLSARRWKAQHERSLINGVVQRVQRSIPTEGDVSAAEQIKLAADNRLQEVLIWRNTERKTVDGARWWRRYEAEQRAPAKAR